MEGADGIEVFDEEQLTDITPDSGLGWREKEKKVQYEMTCNLQTWYNYKLM